MRMLRRFLSLPIRDQRLLVSAIILSFFFKIALRCCSLRTLLLLSSRVYPLFGRTRIPVTQITDRVVWAVSVVARRIPAAANCLSKALTAKFLLALEGYPTVLEIGVKKSDSNQFTAHAWLKSEGRILIGSAERNDYIALPRFDREEM